MASAGFVWDVRNSVGSQFTPHFAAVPAESKPARARQEQMSQRVLQERARWLQAGSATDGFSRARLGHRGWKIEPPPPPSAGCCPQPAAEPGLRVSSQAAALMMERSAQTAFPPSSRDFGFSPRRRKARKELDQRPRVGACLAGERSSNVSQPCVERRRVPPRLRSSCWSAHARLSTCLAWPRRTTLAMTL